MSRKTLIPAMMTTLSAALFFTGVAGAACTISEDFDFGGQTGTVQNNDYLRFYPEGQSGGLPAKSNRTFNDPSWLNKISSVKLSDDCIAVFFMSPNNGGPLQGHQVVRETTAKFSEGLNDKTHGMICECN
ncbi:MAG: hypothetical protein VBE63_15930 [Lamprobacter sp.]|uniref:hypothetical protein n=1 Tax=Lamprobacter sp. TaxID=3100796 RepID=UPI002B25D031|nr:hypothetical protein [Lamprobacter sp.]MEA3641414.1 hypothetical protein [Lamprobacter sp.]